MKKQNESDQVTTTIQISLPETIVEDLKRIALFNKSTVDDLVATYIAKNISEDSRKARRVEFEQQLCSTKEAKNCKTNMAEEILTDSNLMY